MSTSSPQGGARPVLLKTPGRETSDGAGVNLRRMIGTPQLDMLDPFLLLDWFHSETPRDYIAGFPDHPHRGFETVTYLLEGRMRHRDNKGHEGVIEAGGVQWMTAASGIVHSEMPEQKDGMLSGFQLWINLPAAEKMGPARYREFAADRIPVERRRGASLRLIAGRSSQGRRGAVERAATTEPFLADLTLEGGAMVREPLDPAKSVFLMVYAGSVVAPSRSAGAGQVSLARGELAVFGDGEAIEITAGQEGARALLVAGRPLREPVARAGPFVMNTRAEILQAFRDHQAGRL